MENYPHIPDSLAEEYTFTEGYGMDMAQLARAELYGMRGSTAYLPSAGNRQLLEYMFHNAGLFRCLFVELAKVGSQKAIGRVDTYKIAYGDLGLDKTLITYSTHSIYPRPLSASQIRLFKNGKLIAGHGDWTFSTVGIILAAALVSGDTVIVKVLSPEIARVAVLYQYDGDVGTGVGNKIWFLGDLGADNEGQPMTVFPSDSGRIDVYKNGLLRTSVGTSPDYSIVIDGANTTITFVEELSSDDKVSFDIWSV